MILENLIKETFFCGYILREITALNLPLTLDHSIDVLPSIIKLSIRLCVEGRGRISWSGLTQDIKMVGACVAQQYRHATLRPRV